MENPKYEHVQPKHISAENIEHTLVPLKSREKTDLLHNILEISNPYLAIVFTNTKTKADYVAQQLIDKGMKVGKLHGDLTPRERTKAMKQIRNLDFQYIIATDLASRGIDIEGVSHIINFELPQDLDFYIHRAGRTARAGSSGIAITIYEPSDEDALNRLEKMGIEFSQKDIQKGEWITIGDRNKRNKRKKGVNETEEKARSLVKKPNKVKPGYKKKINRQVEEIKKRERRLQKRK